MKTILAALKLDIEDASSAGLLSTWPPAVVEKDIHITEVQADIVDYIVGFYNSVRLHSMLGYCAPNQYEQRHLAKP